VIIGEAESCFFSAVSLFEALMVMVGRGRPAGLNFGDCISYALARSRGLPLLYKGIDFAKTDVISASG
jgi:uncharacterized protein with PIN domain